MLTVTVITDDNVSKQEDTTITYMTGDIGGCQLEDATNRNLEFT